MTVKTAKKPIWDLSTQRYLPFTEIRDNLMIMKDWSSRMVLRVYPVNFALKSEDEQNSIIVWFQRVLNSLKHPIQIIVRSRQVNIDRYIDKIKTKAISQSNPLLQEQTYKYIDFLLNLVDMAQIMRKEFYIVVPFDEDEWRSVRDKWLSWIFKNFWDAISGWIDITRIREQLKKVEYLKKNNLERVNYLKWSLDMSWFKSKLLNKRELVWLLYNYYNPKLKNEVIQKDIDKMWLY